MHINTLLPLPENLKLAYSRITASRLTTCYFAFVVIHCCIQVAFQATAYTINHYTGTLLGSIIDTSKIAHDFAVLTEDGTIRLCRPDQINVEECQTVWAGQIQDAVDQAQFITLPASDISSSDITSPTTIVSPTPTDFESIYKGDIAGDGDDGPVTTTVFVQEPAVAPTSTAVASQLYRRGVAIDPILGLNNEVEAVQVTLQGSKPVAVTLDCVEMLIWPKQTIRNTKRQDATFIGFQFWVLGMSIVAILNESIPHVIAALLTHVLATAWSAFQLTNTATFRKEFRRATIASGRCGGVNLLPNYWQTRGAAEVGVLCVNGVSLAMSIYFTWRLVKMFGWQTFKRIGACLEINRIYKIVLTFSISLQLAFFCIIAFMGLWLDFLVTTSFGQRAQFHGLYMGFAIISCILTAPWLFLGWRSVRAESKRFMLAFAIICFFYIAGWGTMFASKTFKYTFVEWNFFSFIATASFVFLLLTLILGFTCAFNFGKGLRDFLKAQQPLKETLPSSTVRDREKSVGFPEPTPIPTYSLNFGSDYAVKTLDTVSKYSQPTMRGDSTYRSAQGLGRSSSSASSRSGTSDGHERNPAHLERSNSRGSNNSGGSSSKNTVRSYAVAGSYHVPTITTKHQRVASQAGGDAKREWVIE